MIDWHQIDVEELAVLAAVATRYGMGIAGMIRAMHLLSEDEQQVVVAILRQGVGNGEDQEQRHKQGLIHTKGADA